MSLDNYSWLSAALEALPKTVPAALLLYGQRGTGKQLLAQALGQRLLCAEPTVAGHACGRCESCHLFSVGNHPDYRLLQPAADADGAEVADAEKGSKSKKPSTQIPVNAIRDLTSMTSTVSHRGGARVVVITPAEALNPAASNALLKMLEEPGPSTYFVLVAGEIHRLLPTIKSLCFKLSVRVPDADTGAAWLRDQQAENAEISLFLASQAPLAALKLSQDEDFWVSRNALMSALGQGPTDPLELAAVSEKLDPVMVGRLLTMLVFDLLAMQQGGEVRYNKDMVPELKPLADRLPGTDLCRWNDEVRDFTRAANHPLNRRLALESLFATFPGGTKPRRAGSERFEARA